MTYEEFLTKKELVVPPAGIEPHEPNPMMYPFQKDIAKWALSKGRACIWKDCGLGKTFDELEWASQIASHTRGKVLILCPLAVAFQHVAEGDKFGIPLSYARSQSEVNQAITVSNYQMLEHFEPSEFTGIVLDESSILKNFDGKFRSRLISSFRNTPYRLACTATPAPNDYMELGNHAEFVGAMTRSEMLSMFFVHDGGETSQWRLKGHAEQEFWKWVCSWAVMIRKPSDLGYEDGPFTLPPLTVEQITVEHEMKGDYLFPMEAITLSDRIQARRESVSIRVKRCAEEVNLSNEPWVIWCNLNDEADQLEKEIDGAVQICGADDIEVKIQKLQAFSSGQIQKLISKPSITGHGLNWQHCRNVAFVGLSDSWEQYYQAVRRFWRFGQQKEVKVRIITSTSEGAVVKNIQRKEDDATKMAEEMVKNMKEINAAELHGEVKVEVGHISKFEQGDGWQFHLGDCVDVVSTLAKESIGFSVFSPPFESLYTYSASNRDMGNSKDSAEFQAHFAFLIKELYRVIQPGRLASVHCMNLPTSKSHHGYIGLRDFRGDIIRAFQNVGFIFHSEVCIWKDPVTAMQRTKAIGLLHKQMVKDSCMSRQGVPDYVVTMRKPGINTSPVAGELDKWAGDDSFRSEGRLSIDLWQRYASPVWMDINPSRTLQKDSAREERDERHICPLQLDVIERCLMLWSNPDDTVLSPFGGIGSEGYVAVQMGRKFIGVELKESYWKQGCLNLKKAEGERMGDLFNLQKTPPIRESVLHKEDELSNNHASIE